MHDHGGGLQVEAIQELDNASLEIHRSISANYVYATYWAMNSQKGAPW